MPLVIGDDENYIFGKWIHVGLFESYNVFLTLYCLKLCVSHFLASTENSILQNKNVFMGRDKYFVCFAYVP